METPNQIQLTEKDKARYRKEIEQVDLEIEQEVMQQKKYSQHRDQKSSLTSYLTLQISGKYEQQ